MSMNLGPYSSDSRHVTYRECHDHPESTVSSADVSLHTVVFVEFFRFVLLPLFALFFLKPRSLFAVTVCSANVHVFSSENGLTLRRFALSLHLVYPW